MLDVLNIFQEYITASTLVPSHPPLEVPTKTTFSLKQKTLSVLWKLKWKWMWKL